MTVVQPPRIATWLFERLVSAPSRDSLLGDLIERYQLRRSRSWYWAQVLTGIATHTLRDARAHWVLALRAVLVWYLFMWATRYVAANLYGASGQWMWNWTVEHDFDGLRVAWFGRPQWPAPPMTAATCGLAFVGGWLVARLHPRHHAVALLSAVIYCATTSVYFTARTLINPLFSHIAVGSWVMMAVTDGGVPLCVLLGGLMGVRQQEPQPRTSASA